ncbi:class I SAM-dependent methyltransferase, partial [Streptomyces sp. SAS_269]
FWKPLAAARDRGTKRARGWEPLRRALEPYSVTR